MRGDDVDLVRDLELVECRAAASMTGQSLSEPMTMPKRGSISISLRTFSASADGLYGCSAHVREQFLWVSAQQDSPNAGQAYIEGI